jgi:hypothetical protein
MLHSVRVPIIEGAMGSIVWVDGSTSRFFDEPVCDGGVGGALSRDQTTEIPAYLRVILFWQKNLTHKALIPRNQKF